MSIYLLEKKENIPSFLNTILQNSPTPLNLSSLKIIDSNIVPLLDAGYLLITHRHRNRQY